MILINCAACGAELAHDAPRCVRCHTRYCNATCQHDHWRRGHKQMCKKVHRGGNAEYYHADKKYKEAVAEAVEACAEDTKGQTCYICLESVHPHTKEGLVRGCACQGDQGFAHVSCLVRQSQNVAEDRTENNFGQLEDVSIQAITSCKLCGKEYNPAILLALGWGCWKIYASKPELRDETKMYGEAMVNLAICLDSAGRVDEAFQVAAALGQETKRLTATRTEIEAGDDI